jgi:hypothetical protein
MAKSTKMPRASRASRAGGKGTTTKHTKAARAGAIPKNPRRAVPGDWRAETLAQVRHLIQEADSDIVEERKWIKPTNPSGVPVWSHAGIVCTGETYKEVVKLTFARGASLDDPGGLFNSSMQGSTRRAIDIHEGGSLNARAFQALIRAAVALNLRSHLAKSPQSKSPPSKAKTPKSKSPKSKSPPRTEVRSNQQAGPSATPAKPVKLLSGGNPQIAKAEGDAPVQAYIAAMPGWKHDVGRWLDELITRTVPGVRKAVKWNTPFYGLEGQGWFLAFHCITRYIKVTFFRGTSLRPPPPVASKQQDVRYFHIHQDDPIDEAQFAAWVRQASQLPGERL